MPALYSAKSHHQLTQWNVQLEGEWTAAEAERIKTVFERLGELMGGSDRLPARFNGKTTHMHHSGRPGRAGYTIGDDVYLNDDWTDWTLAHELGHRWNNAWGREPQKLLQKEMRAGQGEWLKLPVRRWLKKTERFMTKHWEFTGRLDWRSLWDHTGDGPPPCGVDRNFNASEDFAECFAAAVFPEDAKGRAQRAAKKLGEKSKNWDWSQKTPSFEKTPRGQQINRIFRSF